MNRLVAINICSQAKVSIGKSGALKEKKDAQNERSLNQILL